LRGSGGLKATLMPRQFGLQKFRHCVYFNTNGTLRSSQRPWRNWGFAGVDGPIAGAGSIHKTQ
jgi:hypothetical protein